MKDNEIIMKMIEEVSPDDAAKLDEIDARVWCYLHGYKFAACKHDRIFVLDEYQCEIEKLNGVCFLKYTRSRDALKAIRPLNFEFPLDVLTNGAGFVFGYGCPAFNNGTFLAGYKKPLPTEELAELHAIIQAIAHEREQNEQTID